MALILYSSQEDERGEHLRKVIEEAFPPRELEICRTVDELSSRVHQSIFDIKAMVLLTATKDELHGFLRLRDFLCDLRIIVILSDDEAETIAMAHALRPRFITWLDNDLYSIGLVLRTMTKDNNIK